MIVLDHGVGVFIDGSFSTLIILVMAASTENKSSHCEKETNRDFHVKILPSMIVN